MTLRHEIFWRETANWQEENMFGQGLCTMTICIGHSRVYIGKYREVKGRLFVSYESYVVLLKYMAA